MSIEGLTRGRSWLSQQDEIIEKERAGMGGYGPFERAWYLNRKTTKGTLRRLLEHVNDGQVVVRDGQLHPLIRGASKAQFWGGVGQASAAISSFTAVGTTTSETNLWVPAIWTPIPANDMVAGTIYKLAYGGIFSTSSSAPTSTWTPRCGQSATPATNITLGATTASTMIASLASVPFYGEFFVVIRALGLAASGATGTGNGTVSIGGITTAVGVTQVMGGSVATTIDNTAATGLIISQTWSASSASNTLTCQWVSPVTSTN